MFKFTISQTTRAVIALSQLDERYFRGLGGQYCYHLSFEVFKSNQAEHVVSCNEERDPVRSVSAEADFEAGTYEVRLKVSATKFDKADKIEDVIMTNWISRRNKLLRIGQSYELAHAKAQSQDIEDSEPPLLQPDTNFNTGEAVTRSYDYFNFDEKNKEKKRHGAAEEEPRGRPRERDNPQNNKNPKREPAEEPWKAACVVGLRVYTQNSDAAIQVIYPKRSGTASPKHGVAESAGDMGFRMVSCT